MVNNDGAPNSDDHWNSLSFVINSPSETSAADDQSNRYLSSGDKSLFDEKDDAEALEIERQKAVSEDVMQNGITWFFITLTALLVGSIVQKRVLNASIRQGPHIWTANSHTPRVCTGIALGRLRTTRFVLAFRRRSCLPVGHVDLL